MCVLSMICVCVCGMYGCVMCVVCVCVVCMELCVWFVCMCVVCVCVVCMGCVMCVVCVCVLVCVNGHVEARSQCGHLHLVFRDSIML